MSAPAKTETAPEQVPWMQQLQQLVEQAAKDDGADLAPLIGDGDPNVIEGRVQLHPYRLLQDVSALLTWVEHLDDPIGYRVGPAAVRGAGTQITILGTLLGVEVELIAITNRRVPTFWGPVTIDLLLEVATEEQRELGNPLRSVPLTPAQTAAPLGGAS